MSANFLKSLFGVKSKPKSNENIIFRDPRVRLYGEKVQFYVEQGVVRTTLRVRNLSVSGIAFDVASLAVWPSVGSILDGVLRFHESESHLKFQLIHNTNSLVGCKFVEQTTKLQASIIEGFRVELLALSLVHVDPKILKPRADGLPYYFHGRDNSELYFVEVNGNIFEFTLSLFGHYIEGGATKAFKFGEIVKEVSGKVHGYKRVDPVIWERRLDPKFLDDAVRFIENIDRLEHHFVHQLKEFFVLARLKFGIALK